MEPRIETLTEKKLIGKRIKMTLIENKTFELWKSFMQRRKEILNNLTTDLYSIQVYPESQLKNLIPETEFEKWAAIEVTDFDTVPADMETYILPGGSYAVFIHKGAAGTGAKTFRYIFGTWLPNSNFVLDNNRPHFEILGEKYKNDDPNSEEEVWIPIKEKENNSLI